MKDLIEQAKKAGFETKIHNMGFACGSEECNCNWRLAQDPDLLNLLWLSELQKWLRDKCKLAIEIAPLYMTGYRYLIHVKGNCKMLSYGQFSGSYESVLTEALKQALSLIK